MTTKSISVSLAALVALLYLSIGILDMNYDQIDNAKLDIRQESITTIKLETISNSDETSPTVMPINIGQSDITNGKSRSEDHLTGDDNYIDFNNVKNEQQYDSYVSTYQDWLIEQFQSSVDYISCDYRQCTLIIEEDMEDISEELARVLRDFFSSPVSYETSHSENEEGRVIGLRFQESLAVINAGSLSRLNEQVELETIAEKILDENKSSIANYDDYIQTAMDSFILMAKEYDYLINDSNANFKCDEIKCQYELIYPITSNYEQSKIEWDYIYDFAQLVSQRNSRIALAEKLTQDRDTPNDVRKVLFMFMINQETQTTN